MSTMKDLGVLRVITDTDKRYEKVGEINFCLDEPEIKSHIQKYGHQGLIDGLAFLTYQVWSMLREVNGEKGNEDVKTNPNYKDLSKLN